jgi:PAS domain-containing protein
VVVLTPQPKLVFPHFRVFLFWLCRICTRGTQIKSYGVSTKPFRSSAATINPNTNHIIYYNSNNNIMMNEYWHKYSNSNSDETTPSGFPLQCKEETNFDPVKISEVGIMDELLFNASLDALLDSEDLNDTTTTNSSTIPSFSPSTIMAAPPQGLLTGYSLSAHSLSAGGQTFTPSGLTAGNFTAITSMGPPTQSPVPKGLAQHQQQGLIPSAASSVSSRGSSSKSRKSPKLSTSLFAANSSTKRSRESATVGQGVEQVSDDEEDQGQRRNDRNAREQQRSQKITQQIAELREVLSASNIPFKPDKYSTLVTVADFIKQLQQKSAMLDTEHQKLLDTIAKTNEIVSNQYVPALSTGENPPGSNALVGGALPDGAMSSADDTDMLFVGGIDYKSVFCRCGFPLAVASIDGRFMDCNEEFERFTGYHRDELLPREQPPQPLMAPIMEPLADAVTSSPTTEDYAQANSTRNLSLFNLLSREDMEGVFVAMSEMLKHPGSSDSGEDDTTGALSRRKYFWSGVVRLSRTPDTKVCPKETTAPSLNCVSCLEFALTHFVLVRVIFSSA